MYVAERVLYKVNKKEGKNKNKQNNIVYKHFKQKLIGWQFRPQVILRSAKQLPRAESVIMLCAFNNNFSKK